MADSVDDLELGLGPLPNGAARNPDAAGGLPPASVHGTPAQQTRRSLRGKHVCPFCGATRETDLGPCAQCSLEDTPTTRAATRSKLGPWYVVQSRNPSAPGMNFATLLLLIQKGRVTARSVIRGPTTSQFWRHAARVKGVSREFGLCWHCGHDLSKGARTCANCRRSQEPPADADALLETGTDGGAEDLTEKIWAEDAGREPSQSQSPVERLTARGGVRREVPPGPARATPTSGAGEEADVGEGRLPGNGRLGARHELTDEPTAPAQPALKSDARAASAEASSREARILRREAAARAASTREALLRDAAGLESAARHAPRREAAPRRATVGIGVGYDDDYGDYHLPGIRRGGGVLRKLGKVLLVALLLGAMGVAALVYLDPDGAGRRFSDCSHSAWAWTKAQFDRGNAGGRAGSGAGSASSGSEPENKIEEPPAPATTQGAVASSGDFSQLTPQQAKYKVYELWDQGEAASVRGEHARAVAMWEQIKRLPGVKEEDWPLGLSARIELAKRKMK